MAEQSGKGSQNHSKIPTLLQTSAGGVTFRLKNAQVEIALISVGHPQRWQLPKGMMDEGETLEETALREVREETGIQAELIKAIAPIEYWFMHSVDGSRVRIHKFVHFFLMAYQSGQVSDHDHEVHEARWVEIQTALGLLAFKTEREIVERAQVFIAELHPDLDKAVEN